MKLTRMVMCVSIAMLAVGCGTMKKSSSTGDVRQSVVDTVKVESDGAMAEVLLTNPAEQLSKEWTLVEIGGKKVKTMQRAFITFDFSQKRFYGNNGCNVINGGFECEGSKISFGNMISTRMACNSETSEQDVMNVFNATASVKLREKDGIQYLQLIDKDGKTLASLKEQNMLFMNGAWTVEEINGTPTVDDNVKLVIDIDQLTLHGNSGCNIVNGSIYIDYEKDWGIQFQQLISTMKMCENIKTETALLVALEETETCKKLNDTKIALYNNKGACVAVFKRLHLEKK